MICLCRVSINENYFGGGRRAVRERGMGRAIGMEMRTKHNITWA